MHYHKYYQFLEARPQALKFKHFKPDLYWSGQTDKPVCLLTEQGAGDTVMFARFIKYIPDAQVACDAELVTLLSPLATCHANVIPDDCYYFPLMNVPSFLNLDTCPIEPYLPYDLSDNGKVGICRKGNPKHPNDSVRSSTEEAFQPLLNRYDCIDLHRTGDWSETANIIKDLHAVVSVDTCVAHLAAAMGKQVYLLLGYEHDPRWDVGRWYKTMTMIIKPNWNDAVDVASQLLESCKH